MRVYQKIVIPEGNKKHLFSKHEIRSIKSDRYYANVFCENKKILVRITLKKLEELLPRNFIRISKSVIINSLFVIRIEASKASCCVVLSGEIQYQVTDKYKSQFHHYFS